MRVISKHTKYSSNPTSLRTHFQYPVGVGAESNASRFDRKEMSRTGLKLEQF